MSRTLLLWGAVWPELQASAASQRTRAICDAFHDAGWRVVFASSAKPNIHKESLEAAGFPTHYTELNSSVVDEWLASLRPQVVIYDRFITEEQFGWRVFRVCPEALRVLDTQDLHFLRLAREACLRSSPEVEIRDIAAMKVPATDSLCARELASILRCDLSFVISEEERRRLVEDYAISPSKLSVVAFFYPEPRECRRHEDRRDIMFLGGFRHPPNRDAAQFLARVVWPAVHARLPLVSCHVYGAYPPAEITALHEPTRRFFVHGPVEHHLRCLEQHRLLLSPLRFGAGIKGKIADSWFTGTPVVTTSIGAEGMAFGSGFGGRVADTADTLADAVQDLYGNTTLWKEFQRVGLDTVHRYYNVRTNSRRLVEVVSEQLSAAPERRAADVLGSILWHQSNRATEYFARWIELKNS
jgi:glycosyltransferase involved in cell wall biosynthesis